MKVLDRKKFMCLTLVYSYSTEVHIDYLRHGIIRLRERTNRYKFHYSRFDYYDESILLSYLFCFTSFFSDIVESFPFNFQRLPMTLAINCDRMFEILT